MGRMRATHVLPLIGLGAAFALLDAPPSRAGAPESSARLFSERCASCHTVPDPKIATDRAWLDQVNRTA